MRTEGNYGDIYRIGTRGFREWKGVIMFVGAYKPKQSSPHGICSGPTANGFANGHAYL
jgi:hypothetical protein